MRTLPFRIPFALLFSCGIAFAQVEDNKPPASFIVNYAFRLNESTGGYEFWFTTDGGARNREGRMIRVSDCAAYGFANPHDLSANAINRPRMKPGELLMDGSPTFTPCDGTYGVFASNRNVAMRNDLYEMRYRYGAWEAERIDTLCSPAWEDNPALSPDGKTLFFVSDREAPAGGTVKLFYSKKTGDEWSRPVLLQMLDVPGKSETTPFVGEDGYLYYSTNRNGTFDIWRSRLNEDGLPVDSGAPLDAQMFPGVNTPISDEFHPALSPGTNWFLWTTRLAKNYTTSELKWVRLRTPPSPEIKLLSRLRTKRLAARTGSFTFDDVVPYQTPIRVQNLTTGAYTELKPDKNGVAAYRMESRTLTHPAADTKFIVLQVTQVSTNPKYVPQTYRIGVDVLCPQTGEKALIMRDTTAVVKKGCTFDIREDTVRFFIDGYWCPNTYKYRKFTECASLFPQDSCFTALCTTDDVYQYEYAVNRTPIARCVNYGEFQRSGKQWAIEVDQAIDRYRDGVRDAFGDECVQRGIREGKTIEIDITGYTDPDPLDRVCAYTGANYDKLRLLEGVKGDILLGNPQIADFIKTGRLFNAGGFGGQQGGNQLLSDLRALYSAIMFDRIWADQIPEYRHAKAKGLIKIRCQGKGISKADYTDYAKLRSVRVTINIPSFKDEVFAGLDAGDGNAGLEFVCSTCK